ncbi:hypothetical protein EVA_14909 [gut metagenome]|uniref:Uncharacterized protein n=1 Tax=gut metagenome TaxID=749906 RepID=J9CAM7_9ZZZZ
MMDLSTIKMKGFTMYTSLFYGLATILWILDLSIWRVWKFAKN